MDHTTKNPLEQIGKLQGFNNRCKRDDWEMFHRFADDEKSGIGQFDSYHCPKQE